MSIAPLTEELLCEPVRPRQSRVGLVAYCALPPDYVFVRVPNEPGRWLITLRCVIHFYCPVCKAVEGEPCFNPRTKHYWTGTHASRRKLWAVRDKQIRFEPHKPRLSTTDLREAQVIVPHET